MNQGKIPTIIGLIILIIGLGLGVYLIQKINIFRLGAESNVYPKDVRITNITESSFTVSWTTDKEVSGFVSWGESDGSMGNIEEDEIQGKGFTHSATIRGAGESTNYYFKINSGGENYDNNGIAWQVSTGPVLGTTTSASVISGSLLTAEGSPAKNALVYVTVGGASALSTITSDNGTWVLNLSSMRTSDLSKSFNITPSSDVIEIQATQGPSGTSSAQIYLASAQPVPPMILGQTHNFKSAPANQNGELPEVTLNLPQIATKESKFKTDEKPGTEQKNISITSINEGEVVGSEKPQFFGEGPAGGTITITVESEVVTADIKVGGSGTWSWSPPKNLAPGTHKITLSFRDANGILQTVSKTFIIQASELPAFESTPSATPTQRPTPTPSPIPSPTTSPRATATATPVPTITPSGTPRATTTASPKATPTGTQKATATPVPIPESGTEFPSLLFLILGATLLFGGLSLGGYALYIKKFD